VYLRKAGWHLTFPTYAFPEFIGKLCLFRVGLEEVDVDAGILLLSGIRVRRVASILKAASDSVGDGSYEGVVRFTLLSSRWVDVGFSIICLFAAYK